MVESICFVSENGIKNLFWNASLYPTESFFQLDLLDLLNKDFFWGQWIDFWLENKNVRLAFYASPLTNKHCAFS